jgi:sugar/nucleoside kinase (ribokinase family)
VILAAGEALVEIMRPRAGIPLDRPATFEGPFASGAPAIYASVAARLGAPTALVAVVGDDPFGSLIRTRLASDGVDVTRLRSTPEHATGCAFVAYDEAGERTFVFHMGAAGTLTEADLGDAPERAQWLHVSGSTLTLSEPMGAAIEAAATRVLAAGGRIGLDPNARGAPSPRLRAIAEAATVLFPSEGELQITPRPDQIVVTTLGARGVRVGAEIVPAPEVDEVDPTGAGDAFAAAFTVATLEGAEPIEAARAAVPVAAAAVTRLGPAEGDVSR